MERHVVLKSTLDRLCKLRNLKSWTLHENRRQLVVSMRFSLKEAMMDSGSSDFMDTSDRITYKPKSRYHTERDRYRMEYFNRKQLEKDNAENHHLHHNSEMIQRSLSEPVLVLNPKASMFTPMCNSKPFRMDSSATTEAPSSSADSVMSSECIQNISCVQPSEFNKSLDELRNSIDEAETLLKQCTLSELQCDNDRIEKIQNHCLTMSEPVVEEEYQLPSPLQNELRHTVKESCIVEIEQPPQNSSYTSHSGDPLCDICSASPPSKTLMLHCEHCYFYMCGSCALTNPINHSINCDHQMTYVNPSVPPKPPDNSDQLVPSMSSVYSTSSTNTPGDTYSRDEFVKSIMISHGFVFEQ